MLITLSADDVAKIVKDWVETNYGVEAGDVIIECGWSEWETLRGELACVSLKVEKKIPEGINNVGFHFGFK